LTRRTSTPGIAGRRPNAERGQALVELALVAPLLILLVMALFQVAFVFQTEMGITNAVREAARRAAAVDNPSIGWVREQLCGTTAGQCTDPTCDDPDPVDCPLLPMNVQGFNQSRLVASTPAIGFCTYTVGGIPQYRVTVAVTYDHPEFFPLAQIAALAAGKPAGPEWTWTVGASAEMRLEHDLASAPGAC
jgi:hypothetical protein